MTYKDLRQKVEEVKSQLTPRLMEEAVRTLLRQGEDPGGGIAALRLVKHLLGDPGLRDIETVWAYERLKPTLRMALEQIPTLYFMEGE